MCTKLIGSRRPEFLRLETGGVLAEGHGKPTPLELAKRASRVASLTDVDLNYPDHSAPTRAPRAMRFAISASPLTVWRCLSFQPGLQDGAFTNPDPAVRREAIDLTKRESTRPAKRAAT